MNKILINCDLGECLIPNPDKIVMPLIDMANIACGGHIGDDNSMEKTIKLAKKNKVVIGAHPGYADRQNFGRVSVNLSDNELFDLVYNQVLHFKKICDKNGTKLAYVKPHGALYFDMKNKKNVFKIIKKVIKTVDSNLSLIVPADGDFTPNTNPTLLFEVFADRVYKNGKMLPRSNKNAVLNNADKIIEQYRYFLSQNEIKADTICFHGDNQASVIALKKLKNV